MTLISHEPCPFCGSKKSLCTGHYGHMDPKPWRAECMTCGATGPWASTEQEAMDAWNRRAKE